MDATVAFAKEHGHVQTLFGRKVHTPEINAKGPGAGFARRGAINAPIQGTAADIIRRAMIRIPAAIDGLPATMLLQVHDELVFEVEEGASTRPSPASSAVMEGAAAPAVSAGRAAGRRRRHRRQLGRGALTDWAQARLVAQWRAAAPQRWLREWDASRGGG
jgi:DNA polymerase I-like protein with 3'-5' exonuclease and polymerase domains